MKVFSVNNFNFKPAFNGENNRSSIIKRENVNITYSDEFLRQRAEYEEIAKKDVSKRKIIKAHELTNTEEKPPIRSVVNEEESEEDRVQRILGELYSSSTQGVAESLAVKNNKKD